LYPRKETIEIDNNKTIFDLKKLIAEKFYFGTLRIFNLKTEDGKKISRKLNG